MSSGQTTRRLAAILAADVVGYSRLMGQNEAGTLAALKAIRAELIEPKITQHNGRVFKTIGDGCLAEFPSVVNAVGCAVAIQHAVSERGASQPIQLRIGINVDDVIVEEGDVFGDGVNVAARVESIAPPGGIAVTETVRDHLGSRLDIQFIDLGEQRLKNIDRRLRVYQVQLSRDIISPASIRLEGPGLNPPERTGSMNCLASSSFSNWVAVDRGGQHRVYGDPLIVIRAPRSGDSDLPARQKIWKDSCILEGFPKQGEESGSSSAA